MTTLCIVRHGETDWNKQGRIQGREDIELNETGRQQVLGCIEYLKKSHWDILISSPLIRAFETAKIIGNEIGLKNIEIMPELIERDFGLASGLLIKEKQEKFPDSIVPDAETKQNVIDRTKKVLNIIYDKHTDKNIIVVTHACIIDSVFNLSNHFDLDIKEVKLKNAGITLLKMENGAWDIDLFNYSENES